MIIPNSAKKKLKKRKYNDIFEDETYNLRD